MYILNIASLIKLLEEKRMENFGLTFKDYKVIL